MSKRSKNVENLLKQKEAIENKLLVLQLQLKGIEKSIAKATSSQNNQTEEENK